VMRREIRELDLYDLSRPRAGAVEPWVQVVVICAAVAAVAVAAAAAHGLWAMAEIATGFDEFWFRNGLAIAAVVAAAVSYDGPSRTAILDPVALLAYSTTYTATVKGGASDPRVKDVAGNALATDQTWSFTTAAAPPPPPDEGPGGPILVIAHASNPFSRYYAEILRCEGLNAFTVTDISLVTPAVLDAYDVAILGDGPISPADVTMLTDWVNDDGGNLIAMRPDAQLAPLMGLGAPSGTMANTYLLVNTGAAPGAGITSLTMQFHGTADQWGLGSATEIATLYSDATTATAYPAATTRSVGSNGGTAACFTFDLARSVVYTRQGNPAWAGQERDGTSPIRSNDLYYGNAAGDPQPDWVDLDKVAIPQADEQQRLLANLILHANADRKPLPRFWYLPKGLKGAVVMTGDDHGSAGGQPRFDTYIAQSPGGCSVSDWECVRASDYLYVGPPLTDAQALAYHNQGFEIALHVNTGCADWTQASLESFYDTQLAAFAAAYPSVPPPTTNRTHCIAWSDWATQPKVEAARGIRLDTNYYYWPASWILDRPGLFTGSAMPMRFADLDGTMIDCYQVVTQMTDESGQDLAAHAAALFDRAIGPEGYYGAFCANMHFDSPSHPGSDAIVAAAQSRGIAVVSARQMLEWIDGRNGSSFGSIAWTG
ncbi:MAG: Ig-like domain-containing protein, partial [Gemmatimonadetes bacterium]|nr:Ig-like domain-containing protein [Gemmatimonadota bacterium]